MLDRAQQLEAALDDDLRLRPRDQHARIDGEGEPPEAPLTEDVRQWLTRAPPRNERMEASQLLLLERTPSDIEAGPRRSEHVREQPLRVHARRWAAGLLQVGRSLSKCLGDPHAQTAAASSARRRSSAERASVKSSRSPSSTESRRWSVSVTRWSVTRFSGKL